MKKFIMKNFILFFVLAPIFFGCKGFETQPKFTSVLGANEKTVKLDSTEQLSDNSIRLFFSDAVELQDVYAEFDEKTDSPVSCEVKQEVINGKNAYLVAPLKQPAVGEKFYLNGKIKHSKTTKDFSLVFHGKNKKPASLILSEYKPYGPTKKVKIPEFVELIVKDSGNLFGFVLRSVGNSKTPDYSFPSCNVKAGEIIVVHLNPEKEVNADKNFSDELSEDISSDIKTARDFYFREGRAKGYKTNILVLENSEGTVVDFCAYAHEKALLEGVVDWGEKLQPCVKKLENSAFKKDFDQMTKNPKTVNLTPTKSFSRFSQGTWVAGKKITRGKKNE